MAGTARAPRNTKQMIPKILALIEEFPAQTQVDVAKWLAGYLRTDIIPELKSEMKAAAKSQSGTRVGRSGRGTATRGTMSTAKRRAAGKKAAATRKARGTGRGRNPRTNPSREIHAETETANATAA